MTRSGVTVAVSAALASSILRPVYLVDLENSGPTLYLSTATHPITWNSNAYLYSGQLKGVPELSDTNEIRATGCRLELDGSSSALLSTALTMTQAKKASIRLGFLDSSLALISDPILLFVGYFDFAEISDQSDAPTVILNFESDLLKLGRAGTFRMTDAIQQNLFPGDKGFQYCPLLEDWAGYWGKSVRTRIKNKKRDVKKGK